jgi:transcriptional regulator with XRE-family HTH domain
MRRERGWTLAAVSERTGLAVSTLSKVENNQISLTYNNLAKLAAGLDLDIANFFTGEAIQDSFGRRARSLRGEGELHETVNYAHEYLVAGLLHRRMIPFHSRVKARSLEEFGEFDKHAGEEFLYVLEGAVDVYIEPEGPMRLRAGDSCYFDARVGHAVISVGGGDAYVLTVVTSPGFKPNAEDRAVAAPDESRVAVEATTPEAAG